jgi:hypothetical protein
MVELDAFVFILQDAFFCINFHGGMAVRTGEDAFGEGRFGHGELILWCLPHEGRGQKNHW